MELIIHSPSEDGFIKEITFNHEEIKQELSQRLEKYQGLVYSEDSIKEAKADRATLNKFKEAIENKRKEIKKQCLAPYEDFEKKVKEITAMVDKPISEIDNQVKSFEEKQKEEKKQIIEGTFAESVGDLKDILALDKIWNEKWLNSSYKLNLIVQEISNYIQKVKDDLQTIETLKSKFELQMKDKYLENLRIQEALAVKARLEEQEVKLEEYKKQQEAKQQAAKTPVENPIKKIEPNFEPLPKIEPAQQVVEVASEIIPSMPEPKLEQKLEQTQVIEPELEMLTFRVWVTPEQKKALRDCILNNQIKCGKV